jgi:hypothetical protein
MSARNKLTVAALAALLSSQVVLADTMSQVRLVDPLDEPEYYCLDLSGWGDHLRLEDPLQAHTCKTRGAGDQMFALRDGRILVGDTGRCLEVAGSDTPLSGAAIIARTCSDSSMQVFSLQDNGQISVDDAELCIVVGEQSAEASGPSHVWRILTIGSCTATSTELMTWQVGL